MYKYLAIASVISLFLLLVIMSFLATGCSTSEPAYVTLTNNTTTLITSNYSDFSDHSSRHENAGADLITVLGLSGLLADDQHVLDSEVISAVEATTINGITLTSTGLEKGLSLTNTSSAQLGVSFTMTHDSVSPANLDEIGKFYFWGNDSNNTSQRYAKLYVQAEDVTAGSENGRIGFYLTNNGAWNHAMYLTSDGTLYVDGTNETFDEYDDALLLKKGVGQGDKLALLNAGVLDIKLDEFGNIIPGKYMVNLQNMSNLLAGGIYQNRDYIESLEARILILEKAK